MKGVVSRHDGPDKETRSQLRPGGRQEPTRKERNILEHSRPREQHLQGQRWARAGHLGARQPEWGG